MIGINPKCSGQTLKFASVKPDQVLRHFEVQLVLDEYTASIGSTFPAERVRKMLGFGITKVPAIPL